MSWSDAHDNCHGDIASTAPRPQLSRRSAHPRDQQIDKFNSTGRHHIPRQRRRVTNWRDYDTALRNRGRLTIWFTEEALAGWKAQPRTTPGGQRHYSDLAIEAALTLRAVFRLALRQSEGLIGSIMRMLDIDLPVPDHTTLSRRRSGPPVHAHGRSGTGELHLIVDSTGLKLRGAGEWLFEKHRDREAPFLAQTPYWDRRRQRRNRCVGSDRQGRRRRFACRAPIGSIGRRTSFIHGRRRL